MKARRILGAAFVIVAFGFLFFFIARDVGELRAQQWTIRPILMAASLLLHIAGLVWGVAVWRVVLRSMGYPVPLVELCRIWFVSGLGRYIPGKVWQFIGAVHIGRASGLSAGATVTGLAAQTLFFLIAAAFAALYLVPGALGVPDRQLLILRVFAPLLLVLVHPGLVRAALHFLRRVTGRELVEWTGSWLRAIWIVFLALISWSMTGAALFVFILSLTPIPLEALPAIVGMNALSFIIGNLVFVVPAGLGAKEGALAVMLATYVNAPAAAAIAVAARLWTIAAEVIPAVVLLRRQPRPGREPIRSEAGGTGRAEGL